MEKWCKRHPSHKQSKGVCPCCLRERLSHLSAPSSSTTTNTNASDHSSSPSDVEGAAYSSGSNLSSVAAASPPHLPTDHQQAQTNLLHPSDVDRKKQLLKKSRSLAFVLEEDKLNVVDKINNNNNNNNNKKKKKEKGKYFWSRLIGGSGSSEKEEEAAHQKIARSKTMKDKYSVKCVPF